jgi:DinB family protein
MNKQIDVIWGVRKNFLKLVDGLSIEALNEIPEGLNNNIAWNFGHVIVTQQALCYSRAGLKPNIDEEWILKYKGGTKPEGFIDAGEIEFLKTYLFTLLETLKEDMQTDMFNSYQKFTTGFSVELTSIEDALSFDAMHEGLHLGYAMAIRKLVK